MLQAAKRSKKKPTSKAAAKAESAAAGDDDIYIVPEDFDPAVLGQPDFSSKADAERTMADLFVKRWWDLREQVGQTPPCFPALLACFAAAEEWSGLAANPGPDYAFSSLSSRHIGVQRLPYPSSALQHLRLRAWMHKSSIVVLLSRYMLRYYSQLQYISPDNPSCPRCA